ncbi:alpha/beta hydrolase [Paenibacillus sp. PsM32]|uniref:alpha/beta hydrolase n=1 Tax=unclassified Paenibacillus TaxID=185978 RepID=UPI002365CC12|nr:MULTISPECIES: alpha/beta hydrolase [unclassified Paenibacillus]MDN4618292.1 alpha/beta hydrolase [Paenibacillus sp. PsM32]MDQ1234313.1 acetyl esterase [Paenibacillus sp. SORGH_AS_0306]MDR6111359.1 acetyl esterase [Paenibacillus sp. SORGH_AS_0338]WDF53063.1 alpha/beta hydrolase [Paenibacillus sp. KACC 21273]
MTEFKKVYLEPAAQKFADDNSKPPFLPDLGPEKGRETVDEVQSGEVYKPEVDIEELSIAGGPSGEVSVRILRPKNAPETLPVLVYIHGAGWVFGNSHTHDRLSRELATGAELAVVFVNYSLSPEHKYPTAIEEIYAVVEWIAKEGSTKGLDASKLYVGGDSVGGNMTAAITLMSKERSGPTIQKQLLFYPVTDASFDTESYQQFAEGYFLQRDGMKWFWDQYTTDPNERAQITASPLRATTEQLSGLPEALVITGEADVLRDEGEAYANKLREAGVPVTAVRFQGIIHDFVMLNVLADTNAKKGAIKLATTFLREGF